MKKFIIKLIFVLTPIFLLLVSVNFVGDAANLFSKDYEQKIAIQILKGNNVTNVINYDERLLQKCIVNDATICPDIVVLGSSREMLINASFYKNQTFFNNAVSGASIEDLLAIYQLYEQKNFIPKRILLGLDPWTLNINNGQDRWSSLSKEFSIFHKKLFNSDLRLEVKHPDSKYLQIVSPSYFKSSLRKLLLFNEPVATKNNNNEMFTKLKDGSISYDLKYKLASEADVSKRSLEFISGEIYSVEKFDKLSEEIIALLEKFIIHCQKKNIQISFFLAPYHPTVYSFICSSKKYHKILESENFYIALGKKYNVKVVGSFDPFLLGVDNSCFYDGMHSNEKGINKILLGNNCK